jgi:7-carboxy-7-deazaguanine synthase
MRITEIYQSIQGESSYAGLPCVFVRTTGCDLRCSWCDSEFAFHGGAEMSINEIIVRAQQYPARLIELTGGEPLLQKDIPLLARELLARGYTVMIETGGHRDISVLDDRIIKIIDIKCPASGESEKNLYANLDLLSQRDEIKFVIANRGDYEWALSLIRSRNLEERFKLLISPAHNLIDPQSLVEWMLADGLQARFQLQLHKYVWPPHARGV